MPDLDIKYNNVKSLVTDKVLTNAFVNAGDPIDIRPYNQLILWTDLDIGDSENVQIKVLLLNALDGAVHEMVIQTISATDVKLKPLIYEYDIDSDQKTVFIIEIPPGSFAQIQIKDDAGGTGVLTIDYSSGMV